MSGILDPFRSVLIALAGWMNQRQLHIIDYLREENRVLRELLGDRRLQSSDGQRRRLAVKARRLGRKILAEVATIVTPEALLAWFRKLIAYGQKVKILQDFWNQRFLVLTVRSDKRRNEPVTSQVTLLFRSKLDGNSGAKSK